ncbi:F-box only protein 15 [Pseudoliparis swirei]|uniref:F-box only protein 15 n=1 Tax=Pseudoliparis swirei TaxID=2059687 RepID=UPI0024BDD73F|nr:F-box only protein 15 [Pseudoliparis swirei]
MAAPRAVTSRMRTSKRADKSYPASTLNFLKRLPSEILIKILSYLDAAALFSIIHVSRLFYQLANDEALWNRIYIVEVSKKKKRNPNCVDKQSLKMATLELHDRAAGHWKQLYFKTVASYGMNMWRIHLGLISGHTGLPSRTERVLRNLLVTWELTVSDRSGHEGTHELSWSKFCETSVTLCWSGGGCLPDYQQISTLQLHGVRRIALNCPGLKKPGWRSLMANVDMPALTQGAQVIGQDRLVELKLLQPGMIIGVWRERSSVAFVMFTLHFHRLVERSIQGSSVCPYVEPIIKSPLDDIDPEYGLHGYQLHIVLHNTACEIMSGSFPPMFCKRTQICDGFIQLTAISRAVISQHTPLSSRINIPWRCEALHGAVKNCCIMSLTLLDEFKKPFWCVCSPVSMELEKTPVSYDFDGEHFLIHHRDSDGQVKMNLVWMEEQRQLVLISLVVYVTVCKVNEHFSRNY